jgi:hypothetical protein
LFAGSYVVDGHRTEINVISPAGIRAIEWCGGPDIAANIPDAIVTRRDEKQCFFATLCH